MVSLSAWSDGIGFTPDHKHLFGPHTVLKLSPKQQTEVEQLRTLTLTKEQRSRLVKASSKAPAKIPVLTSRYTSCTCGMGPFVVWFRPGEVEIGAGAFDRVEAEDPPAPGSSDAVADTPPTSLSFIVDSKCQIYNEGHPVTEEGVRSLISGLGKGGPNVKPEDLFVYLDPPPPIDPKTDSQVQDMVNRLAKHCKEHKVPFNASEMEPKETE